MIIQRTTDTSIPRKFYDSSENVSCNVELNVTRVYSDVNIAYHSIDVTIGKIIITEMLNKVKNVTCLFFGLLIQMCDVITMHKPLPCPSYLPKININL
jgi:hypothetical protein